MNKPNKVAMQPVKNRVVYCPGLLFICIIACNFLPISYAESKIPGISQKIDLLLSTKQLPLLQQSDFSEQAKDVAQLYRFYGKQLIWFGEGRSEKNLNDVLQVLSNAAEDGLNPVSYDADQLRYYAEQAAGLEQNDIQQRAAYDLAISISILRYMHDVHFGRIDPQSFNYPPQFGAKRALNSPLLLKQHIDSEAVSELPLAAAPKARQYALLRSELVKYRQASSYEPANKLVFPKALHPGDSDPQMPELRQRLRDMGELSAEDMEKVKENETVYDEASVSAISRLQQQQGLQSDGLIGKQTLALINQTPKEKIALIELALERLRWMPELPSGPQILVNIPAFQLWAYNFRDDPNALSMKVVVGKAEENQTPILSEEMKYLEFMPYWNIPRSILDKEILPKIQSGRNYLADQAIELVDQSTDDEELESDSVTDNIRHGRFRARQLPGKKNPLGKVKFIFPNKADVYLHDTPFRSAFSRDRRDLSHGCVRVSDAVRLAEFVIGDQSKWDRKAIQEAMGADAKTQRVNLKKTIPVLFFYSTAYAGEDNKLRFYPDIYGYDALLQNAINKTANNRLVTSKSANSTGG
jgi:L,D-transpeptidase YcbB